MASIPSVCLHALNSANWITHWCWGFWMRPGHLYTKNTCLPSQTIDKPLIKCVKPKGSVFWFDSWHVVLWKSQYVYDHFQSDEFAEVYTAFVLLYRNFMCQLQWWTPGVEESSWRLLLKFGLPAGKESQVSIGGDQGASPACTYSTSSVSVPWTHMHKKWKESLREGEMHCNTVAQILRISIFYILKGNHLQMVWNASHIAV